jgi:hypothetical protein
VWVALAVFWTIQAVQDRTPASAAAALMAAVVAVGDQIIRSYQRMLRDTLRCLDDTIEITVRVLTDKQGAS